MRGSADPAADRADLATMRLVQADKSEAFDALYDRLARRAYAVAHAIVRDGPLAEDVVQESFLALWRSRERFAPELGPVSPWFLGIVRNRAVDELRRQRRHSTRRAEALERDLTAPDNVEARVDEREQASRLQGALDRLPAAQREVIALAYYGELSHTEIAAHLGLPEGTVKGRMRLGLSKLRSDAGAQGEGGD